MATNSMGPELSITFDKRESAREANKAMDAVEKVVKNRAHQTSFLTERIFRNTFRGLNSLLRPINHAFTTLNTILLAIVGTRFARFIETTTQEFLTLNNVLVTMTGSLEDANEQFDFLTNLSSTLGFDVLRLSTAYTKLTAAGKIARFETEKLQEIMAALSETAVVTGMSSFQLEGAIRAITQMMSKGRVQAEELRGQLGEHLPGAFELAAIAMGKTTAELEELMVQGRITAKELFENLPQTLRDVYGPGLEGALRTRTRELERFKTDVRLLIADFGSGLREIQFASIATMRRTFNNFASELDRSFNESLSNFADKIQAFPTLVGNIFSIIGRVVNPIVTLLVDGVGGAFSAIGVTWGDVGMTLIRGIIAVGNAIQTLGATIQALVIIVSNTTSAIFQNFRRLGSYIASLPAIWGQQFKLVGLKIAEGIAKGLQFAAEKFNEFFNWLSDETGIEALRFSVGFQQSLSGLNDKIIETSTNILGMKNELNVLTSEMGASTEFWTQKTIMELDQLWGSYKEGLITLEDFKEAYNDFLLTQEAFGEQRIAAEMAREMQQSNIDKLLEGMTGGLTGGGGAGGQDAESTFKSKVLGRMNLLKEEVTELANVINDSLTRSFDEFLDTGRLNFRSFLEDLAKDLLRMNFQNLVAGPLSGMISGGVQNLFRPSGMAGMPFVPMQHGGVIQKPVSFSGDGVSGSIGEAGAEGVLPLTRTSGGDLGVKASGSGGGVIININNNSNADVETESSTSSDGRQIIDFFINAAADDIRNNGALAQSVMGMTGMHRVGVTR